jgi:uncharacterized OsmC-like protein
MSIADAVAAASKYLTEHPEEALYRDSAATARLGHDLRVEVSGPGGETLNTDMPRAIGGRAAVPSPGWYLRAAAAACVASLIGIRAAALGIALPVGSVEVSVDSESDDRGILGLGGDVPAGALSVLVVAAIDAPRVDRVDLDALLAWAVDHCPVTDALRRSVPLSFELR